jgi:hypothetical protein
MKRLEPLHAPDPQPRKNGAQAVKTATMQGPLMSRAPGQTAGGLDPVLTTATRPHGGGLVAAPIGGM